MGGAVVKQSGGTAAANSGENKERKLEQKEEDDQKEIPESPDGSPTMFAFQEGKSSDSEDPGDIEKKDSSTLLKRRNRKSMRTFNRTLSLATEDRLTLLPAGGYWFQIGDATCQIGCPPETIKDSMTLGLEVPRYFIVYGELFSRTLGINTAELEFPAYFNFFIRKKRTVILTTKEIEERIRCVFQETLLGPARNKFNIADDFDESVPSHHYPDFTAEGEWLDPARKSLSVDSLLMFKTFEKGKRKLDGSDNETTVYQVDIDENIHVVYDPNAHMFLIDAPTILPTTLRVPQEVIKIQEKQSPENKFTLAEPEKKRLKELPLFGVTMLGTSHGFDPLGSTTGFVLWANRRGTMVDPPSNAMALLEELGISSRVIDSIVLTHCHSDHDAGTFRKLLFDQHIKIYTTKTILDSFIRKYSAITDLAGEFLLNLFDCKAVKIGQDIVLHGAKWSFRYSLHTIPCIGFTVRLGGKSITYSADTHTDPELANRMYEEKVIGIGRRDTLANFPWNCDMILHEAGVPPIHTPMNVLKNLPTEVKNRLYVVHVARKDVPADSGLRCLNAGDTKTLDTKINPGQRAIEILDLVSTMDIFREAMVTFEDALDLMYMIDHQVFSDGDLICKKGDDGDRCFIIIRGTAVVKWEVDGMQFYKYYHVGDYFGETSLVTGEKRNADVFSCGQVEVVSLTKDTFMSLIKGTNIKEELISLAKIRFSSACKTQLETIMHVKKFSLGEPVWLVGDDPEVVLLVRTGSFRVISYPIMQEKRDFGLSIKVDEASGSFMILHQNMDQLGYQSHQHDNVDDVGNFKRKLSMKRGKLMPQSKPSSLLRNPQNLNNAGNKDEEQDRRHRWSRKQIRQEDAVNEGTFGAGTVIGDFDSMLGGAPVSTEVVCDAEEGSVFVIKQHQWVRFCCKFPGSLLFFMGKQVVT